VNTTKTDGELRCSGRVSRTCSTDVLDNVSVAWDTNLVLWFCHFCSIHISSLIFGHKYDYIYYSTLSNPKSVRMSWLCVFIYMQFFFWPAWRFPARSKSFTLGSLLFDKTVSFVSKGNKLITKFMYHLIEHRSVAAHTFGITRNSLETWKPLIIIFFGWYYIRSQIWLYIFPVNTSFRTMLHFGHVFLSMCFLMDHPLFCQTFREN
jgi:hypothetical protein